MSQTSDREERTRNQAGFIIVFLAAVLAIVSLLDDKNNGYIQNATIQTSNLYAWYQAKNVRGVLNEISALETTNAANKERFLAEKARMDTDKKEIMAKAKALEAEREVAEEKSPYFTYGLSTLQIAIVILTASILLASAAMLYVGAVGGIVGVILSSQAIWMWIPWLS